MAIFQRNGGLEAAMATLLQNQAAFLARASAADERLAELERLIEERFASIQAILLEHSQILAENGRMLEQLPEVIHARMGFKPPDKPAGMCREPRGPAPSWLGCTPGAQRRVHVQSLLTRFQTGRR
jgi:hypothetical protein